MCTGIFLSHMSVGDMYAYSTRKPEVVIRSPGTKVPDACDLPHVLEINTGSPKEQQVFLQLNHFSTPLS